MEVSQFTGKLNFVEGQVHVIEEEVALTGGVYEAALKHDKVNIATFAIYTGAKLTGERIENYILSEPSLAPWKYVVRVYADVTTLYLSYETEGDVIEAEDINGLQEAIVETQEAIIAGLSDRYTKEEVLAKFEELIGAAPEALDTLHEIAEALGNDPNFAGTMITQLGKKVDKVAGKGLSTNDLTDDKAAQLTEAYKNNLKVTQQRATSDTAYRVLLSASGSDEAENDTAYKSPGLTYSPARGELFAQGYQRIDLTGSTTNLDDITLWRGYPQMQYYIQRTDGGASAITNIPVPNRPFILDVELIRRASAVDYITLQTFRSSAAQDRDYVRYCISGAWGEWLERPFAGSAHAELATRAEQDSDGNVIKDTYLKKGRRTWGEMMGD